MLTQPSEVGSLHGDACQDTSRFSGRSDHGFYLYALGHGGTVEAEGSWFLKVSRAVSYRWEHRLCWKGLMSRLLGPIAHLKFQVICSSSAEHRKEEADAFWWFVYFSIIIITNCRGRTLFSTSLCS